MKDSNLSDDQIFRIALRNLFKQDIAEVRQDLHELKEAVNLLRDLIDKMTSQSHSHELLTMDELSVMLKLSKPSIYKLIREKKKLQPIQLLDQDTRFKREDVEKMINDSYRREESN